MLGQGESMLGKVNITKRRPRRLRRILREQGTNSVIRDPRGCLFAICEWINKERHLIGKAYETERLSSSSVTERYRYTAFLIGRKGD